MFNSLGKIDEAIQDYQKVIEIQSKHVDAYNNLGQYLKKGVNAKNL